jgi:hypothetical protein
MRRHMASDSDGFITFEFDEDEQDEPPTVLPAADDDEDDVELHGASSYN